MMRNAIPMIIVNTLKNMTERVGMLQIADLYKRVNTQVVFYTDYQCCYQWCNITSYIFCEYCLGKSATLEICRGENTASKFFFVEVGYENSCCCVNFAFI